jgi:two-component system, OmpR family, sensor histidine kinase MtrB
MRELRPELAAFPDFGRASMGGGRRPLSLVARSWRKVRSRTGLDRLVGLRREVKTLQREAELKDGFIALAAHELRAPAAIVSGFSQTLAVRGRTLPRKELAELHDVLNEQSLRLNRLIDQLLDLSRLEADVFPREPELVPVRRRLDELVRSVAGGEAAGIAVNVPHDLQVLADGTAFERIAANLVTNAIHYGREPIEIRAAREDGHFRLCVTDSGEGVPDELVPRLFERFTRGEGGNGSGLGLSIAQSYAQASGGQILYEPTDEGGARFELVLPAY